MNKDRKKVLITGSSGFLGSHLADALYKNGFEVILFDKHPSHYKQKDYKEIIGDTLSVEDISKAIKGCSYVYHYAAQADIDSSTDSPKETIQTNILGTQNILEAAKENNIERFLFASTIYVYSELGSFYRVSKQACEKLIEEYQKEYNLNYTILRYGSLYGSRSNEFNSIANMLLQALKEQKIERRGDGKEIREYIHVKDAAELSVKALENIYNNKHLVISGAQTMRIKDLLSTIKEIFNNSIEINYLDEKELHHYKITPYSYRPQVAQRIAPEAYHDLGQGLLDLIYELEEQLEQNKTELKISLRGRKRENS